MIADGIALVLSNIPTVAFVLAIILAFVLKRPAGFEERLFGLLLLLPVGIGGIWAGIFHIFFPTVASGQIGWQASPFETEIGLADLASGIVAVIAFWRSLAFKSAIAAYTILFFIGVAIGHFYQAFAHGDYSADNFGLLLVVTILQAALLAYLLWAVWRKRPVA